MSKELVCPNCGSGIEVMEGLLLNHDTTLEIYCGGAEAVCGATWSRYGDPITDSKLETQ